MSHRFRRTPLYGQGGADARALGTLSGIVSRSILTVTTWRSESYPQMMMNPEDRDPHTSPGTNAVMLGDMHDAAIEEWAGELIGRLIDGRYRLDSLLGYGGTGGVFRGTHIGLNKPVAVKILHEELRLNPEVRRRFEREALAASRLSHPGCIDVVDVGEEEELSYLVMAFVEGIELRDMMGSNLSLHSVLSITQQILAALEHAHSHGVIHRDVKPENIMVTTNHRGQLQVKLLDFGLAKVTLPSDQQRLTAAGQVFGTPQYMSPEQARGTDVGPLSDLYSTGLILYEMLCDSPVYDSDDPVELVRLQMTGPVPRLAGVVPDATIPVLDRLLAKSPEDRFASSAEARSALERASLSVYEHSQGGRPGDRPPPEPSPARAPARPSSEPTFARASHGVTLWSGCLPKTPPSSARTELALAAPCSLEQPSPWPSYVAVPVVPTRRRESRQLDRGAVMLMIAMFSVWAVLAALSFLVVALSYGSTWMDVTVGPDGTRSSAYSSQPKGSRSARHERVEFADSDHLPVSVHR